MNRRNTIQRELVLEAVRSLGNHATAEEIYECVMQTYPSIGKGTVYRNLNLLAEHGEIRKISPPFGADHFDHNCTNHYHVSCIHCGKMFDVDMDVLPDLTERIGDTHGIAYLDYDILFRGVCEDCQKLMVGDSAVLR